MGWSGKTIIYNLTVLLLIIIPTVTLYAEGTGSTSTVAPSVTAGSSPVSSSSISLQPAPSGAQTVQNGTLFAPPIQSGSQTTTGMQPNNSRSTMPGNNGNTNTLTPQAAGTDGTAITTSQTTAADSRATEIGGDLSTFERSMLETGNSSEKAMPQEFKVKALRQFGYSFFRPETQGFAALTDVPVSPDYQLGTGDRISVTLWGSIEGSYEFEINRSGEITLPKIGTVKVAGINFGKLHGFLNGQLARVFKDFQLNVTMGKLRMIKVYLVGEVKSPGDYNISSLSTLLNALSAAGGPTRSGTLRSIAIKRDGKVIETVDLYDFFLKGDKSRDIRLQAGDTIFVPSIGPVVGMAGNVRRPAIYELKNEKTLKELLAMADGIIPTGYLQRLQISRVEAHDKKIVTDVSLDTKNTGKNIDELTSSINVKDMDLVKIFPIDGTLRGYARLEGYVLRPGDYALQPGMRLDQLLGQDNLLPEYYTEAGQILRLFPPDFHPEMLYFNVSQAISKDPAHNLELKEFDTVRIFSRWEMEEMPKVRISGEIQKPGDYRLFTNMRVRDLLMSAGNTKTTAYLKNAEITRINKTDSAVTSYPIVIDLGEVLKGNPQHNILLTQHDELTIRKIPNWSEENERYITLKGEFVFPGTYPVYKGEKLSAVIKRAGGFSPKAYLYGSKFTRTSVRELQQKRMDEFVSGAELEVSSKMTELSSAASSQEELASAKSTLEGVRRSLQLLKAAKAEGRMVIHLDIPERFTNSQHDIEVMGGDVLEVPLRSNAVSVLGRVYNPTSFVFMEGSTVGRYLNLAGGMTNDSNSDEVYVVRADGSIFSTQQYSSLGSLFGNGFIGEKIASGDAIVVPQKFQKTALMRDIKDITTIMSQLAITAGTIMLGLR